jgi:hypothetical protein
VEAAEITLRRGESAREAWHGGQATDYVTVDTPAQGRGGYWNEASQSTTGRGGGRWARGSRLEQTPAGQSSIP